MSFDNETDDFLAHFGVKGMKWGRRNAESRAREARDTPSNFSSAKPAKQKLTPAQKAARNERIKQNVGDAVAIASIGAFAAYSAYHAIQGRGWDRAINNAYKAASAKKGRDVAGRMLGDLGKSLPYAKIAKGAYKVTSMK